MCSCGLGGLCASEYGECELSLLHSPSVSRVHLGAGPSRSMRSTRLYFTLLALVAIVLCTSSKGATMTTTHTLACRAATLGPRRLNLAYRANGATPCARGLNNRPERALSRRVARSGQRAPDRPASLSLSPGSSSYPATSSKDDVPDLPAPVITFETEFAPPPAIAPDLKPNRSHPDTGTRTRSSPQLAKRCHYIGTFFRRSVSSLTTSAKVGLQGFEAERGDFRRDQH